MKQYAGEEFLNRLYKDLVHSDEVKHTAKGRNKNEDLAIYLGRLERITNETRDKDRLGLLKHFYYKRYIIKEEEVPENYFETQEKIALERGYGHIKYDDKTKKREINSIISEQKASLDSWLDYFISEDTNHYPMWFKYYVFQNVMKIGYFDKEKNEFTKRTKSTVKPFIEINREAISMLYDELSKYLDKQEISDEKLEQLIKNGSFNKIYSYITRKLDSVKKLTSNSNEGIWKKYEQGSAPEILFNDIHGKGTGWCTAGGINTASSHLEGGDFHVYYTKDENGDYTNPRIAIRMNYNKIAEIRGIAENQNLESEMESVVEEKLQEFPDKDEYKKKVSDMKMLTKIYNKYKNNEELTKEELRFMYEIDYYIIGFGYEDDPRIEEILEKRNIRKDLAFLLDVTEEEISLTREEALEGNKKYHYGDLLLNDIAILKNKVLPEKVIGKVDLRNLTVFENSVLPKEIKGYLFLDQLESAEELVLPDYIGGDLDLSSLLSLKGVVFPKEVGKNLSLESIKDSQDLVLPNKIGGYIDLKNLENVEKLMFPEKTSKDIYLDSLKSAKGVIFPKQVNGDLGLNGLESTEGLKLPEKINGNIYLDSLESAKGLVLPTYIESGIYLNSLKSAEELILPDKIEGDLILENLVDINGLVLPRYIGGDLDLGCIIDANGLVLPEEIGGHLYLNILENAKGLIFPKKVGLDLCLAGLTSANGITLPEEILGALELPALTSAEGLVLPKKLTGGLCLSNLKSAKGLILPDVIDGYLDLRSLESAEELILPNEIGGYLDLKSLESANGLVLPRKINGYLNLESLERADGLVLPEEIGGYLYLSNLKSCEGLIFPRNIYGEYYVPGGNVHSHILISPTLWSSTSKRTEMKKI